MGGGVTELTQPNMRKPSFTSVLSFLLLFVFFFFLEFFQSCYTGDVR